MNNNNNDDDNNNNNNNNDDDDDDYVWSVKICLFYKKAISLCFYRA